MDGIINVFKESGYTSHDVVAKLRGILKQKKIGHTGTLDPMATGVLPICVGNATKVSELIMEKEKAYIAEVRIGLTTDTLDITGKITNRDLDIYEKADSIIEKIPENILSFKGDIKQIPPMYSAIKVNGKKLYTLAREGIEIERKPRKVHIYDIYASDIKKTKEEGYNYIDFTLYVRCSKGTYIRSLVYDIGVSLGTYAVMTELTRLTSGIFNADDSVTLGELQEIIDNVKKSMSDMALDDKGELSDYIEDVLKEKDILISVDSIFNDLGRMHVKREYNKVLLNGNKLKIDMIADYKDVTDNKLKTNERYRVYDSEGNFRAIYECIKGELKPLKMFL